MSTDRVVSFDLIAIDLDGTLVDSVGDLHEAVVHMQRAVDMPCARVEQVRGWVGNGIERLVHRALSNSMNGSAEDDLFQRVFPVFCSAYESVNGTKSTLYPGVFDGLQWLSSQDVPLCMVTNKARQFACPLLKSLDIDGFFDHRICGDDVTLKKPDPAALLLAAHYSHAEPRRSVLIGDSISDFKAARAAEFASVGVSYGYNHGQSVRELCSTLRPDVIIDSFYELPEAFQRLATQG